MAADGFLVDLISRKIGKELANNANAAIVFVNYTLSPEAKYPVSLEQA
jgi:acetyl esterase/lipase